MGGDSMPPPPPGEEEHQQQQPAAGAVLLQPLESDSSPAVKEDREKASRDQSSSQDMNFLIRAQRDSSTDEHIQLFLDKYNLMRGYVHTACCSRNTICGESYYPVGAALSNPEGWTCYVNCILQCVVHTIPLVLKLRKDDHTNACPCGSDEFCWYCSLQFHVAEVIHVYGSVLYPKKFVEHLKLLSENFQWGQHQDAHEFLRCLLDKLDEACVPPPTSSERPSSIVKEVFGGQLKSQLHCPECNYCSDRFEPFLDLNLEVIPKGTVMDALKSFTKIEVFENFGCDGCKSRVNMEKQLKVEQAPEVLVIQLKRFQNFGSDISKIRGKVEYHSELDLNPFMSSPDNKPQKYDLYGVVKHEGVSSNGHYVCYIRSSRTNWFHFDDCKVMKISEVRALDTEAYLLFYIKKGSYPWFSTLIKRENYVSGDIEGSYSSSSSEDDCCPATSSWHIGHQMSDDSDETRSPRNGVWDGVLEEEEVDRQCKKIIDMQKEKCCESEIQEKARIEGDSSTHATYPCPSKDDIKGSDDSPAGALLGPVGSNSDSIAEGKCTSKAVVQEEAIEPLLQFSMNVKLLEQPLLSLPEASDKEWAVERHNGDSDETSMWDDVHEEEDVNRQHNEIIDMQKEKCCERELEGDSRTHATHPCTSKEVDIKGSDSPAGALLGPVGSNFDSIAEGKCTSKAVVQEEAMREEPLQNFSMYDKLLEQLLSLPEASDKEWAVVRRNDDGDKSRSTRKRTSRWDKDTAMGEGEKRQCLKMFAMIEEILGKAKVEGDNNTHAT